MIIIIIKHTSCKYPPCLISSWAISLCTEYISPFVFHLDVLSLFFGEEGLEVFGLSFFRVLARKNLTVDLKGLSGVEELKRDWNLDWGPRYRGKWGSPFRLVAWLFFWVTSHLCEASKDCWLHRWCSGEQAGAMSASKVGEFGKRAAFQLWHSGHRRPGAWEVQRGGHYISRMGVVDW